MRRPETASMAAEIALAVADRALWASSLLYKARRRVISTARTQASARQSQAPVSLRLFESCIKLGSSRAIETGSHSLREPSDEVSRSRQSQRRRGQRCSVAGSRTTSTICLGERSPHALRGFHFFSHSNFVLPWYHDFSRIASFSFFQIRMVCVRKPWYLGRSIPISPNLAYTVS